MTKKLHIISLFTTGLLLATTAQAHPGGGYDRPPPPRHHNNFGAAIAGGILGGVIGGAIIPRYGYGYSVIPYNYGGPYNYYNGTPYPYGYNPYPMNYSYSSPNGGYLEYQQYQAVPAITRCGYDPYGNYACLRVQ